jgi:hypothetical protein
MQWQEWGRGNITDRTHYHTISHAQRLAEENREQQDLIHQLLLRVDKLEEHLNEMAALRLEEEEARARQQAGKRGGFSWGGFFGPSAAS